MNNALKHMTVKGTVWSAVERLATQSVSFVVMIIMARVLTPADYGLVGMVVIFVAISQSLVDSGFSQALIRKQNRTQIDNSTVFYFNVAVGIGLYAILFLLAPAIASFYGEPRLVSITRIVSLSIVINSFTVVQRALLTAKLDFKLQAKASFTAALIAGCIGVLMAYNNFGVWSIIVYQIVNHCINCFLLWLLSSWRPTVEFSSIAFRNMFGFGSKLALSGIIDTVYKNVYLIVIGKVFSPSDLGYYTRAHQFSDFPSSNITGILQRVTFPVLCSIQDDDIKLSRIYRQFLRISAYAIFPMMVGLAAVANPLVVVLLNEQWAFTAILLQILCFGMMWYPIHAINLNLLQVKGRSDLLLKLEIYKKIIGVAILCVTIPFGLIAICIGTIVASLVSLFINTRYTGKLIHVGFKCQMVDLLPILLLSLCMGGVVYGFVVVFELPDIISLGIGILIGLVFYVGISALFKFPELQELRSLVRR